MFGGFQSKKPNKKHKGQRSIYLHKVLPLPIQSSNDSNLSPLRNKLYQIKIKIVLLKPVITSNEGKSKRFQRLIWSYFTFKKNKL